MLQDDLVNDLKQLNVLPTKYGIMPKVKQQAEMPRQKLLPVALKKAVTRFQTYLFQNRMLCNITNDVIVILRKLSSVVIIIC